MIITRTFKRFYIVVLIFKLLPGSFSSSAQLEIPKPATTSSQPQQVPKPPVAVPFEMMDGDRILFLGDTLIEREIEYGYLETRIHLRFPKKNLVFRNLGWSGDSVWGESRAGFDPPEKGLERLLDEVSKIDPTVVFLGYGTADSFYQSAGLPRFVAGLVNLMKSIDDLNPDIPIRYVLLGTAYHEDLKGRLSDGSENNKWLQAYSRQINRLAVLKDIPYASIHGFLRNYSQSPFGSREPLTDNGIHLTRFGYNRAVDIIERGLNWKANTWRLGVTPEMEVRDGCYGAEFIDLQKDGDTISVRVKTELLAPPPMAELENTPSAGITPIRLQYQGLSAGQYALFVDGEPIITGDQADWLRSLGMEKGPAFDRAEQVRLAVVRKNRYFFNRWRPQNVTYLFGFRKHEQGQNAREIPMFDPLILEMEKEIAELKLPTENLYELKLIQEGETFDIITAKERFARLQRNFEKKFPMGVDTTPTEIASLATPDFQMDDEFEITLWAEDPLLHKPIQMNFDAQGRLWVASSETYPQIQPGQKANDKILILQDADHDGRAEKSTVFADGLMLPTGIEPGNGGAYVGQSTKLLHLRDTDGDGKADQRKIVLSGFGTEDTHHILHTLRWGYDGMLYFNQSIYIHSHIETPHGVVRLNSGGVFRFDTQTLKLDVFLKGFCNPWGHHFNRYGDSFITDGAGFQGLSFGMPGAMYFTYAGAPRILESISSGTHPKYCGLEIIESNHFPKEWQGDALTCDFRAHRIVRFKINEQDSSYKTEQMPDLVRTSEVSFRPIDLKIGPDGALYVADWSNPIIQHGEVDFRDPRRDKVHGRIWRITHKKRALNKAPNLVKASNTVLLNSLISPNRFQSSQSRRLLIERGESIRRDLEQWAMTPISELAELQILWLYHSLGETDPERLQRLLASEDPGIRSGALRVLALQFEEIESSMGWLAKAVTDKHPRVRLTALRVLGQIPNAQSAELALSVLNLPMDTFLDYALWLTVNDLRAPWIKSLDSGEWSPEGREEQLEFALKSLPASSASRVIGRLLKMKPISENPDGPIIELIGEAGTIDELDILVREIGKQNLSEKTTIRAFKALLRAARLRGIVPQSDKSSILSYLGNESTALSGQAALLAGQWKLDEARSPLLNLVGNSSTDSKAKQSFFNALRSIGGNEVLDSMAGFAADSSLDYQDRRQAAVVLLALDSGLGAQSAYKLLLEDVSTSELQQSWRSFLSVKAAGESLRAVIPDSELKRSIAEAGLKVLREGGQKDKSLMDFLVDASGLDQSLSVISQTELAELVLQVKNSGDPYRGEEIYRKKQLACLTCHSIGGSGGLVGPDMTSIGAAVPVDYLAESLFFPNRKIKEGYHSVEVLLKDDQEIMGVFVREDDQELFLRNALDQIVSVAKRDIEKREIIPGSLMPSGLIDELPRKDQIDVIRFLSELGKTGSFDGSGGNIARTWNLFLVHSTIEQFGLESMLRGEFSENGWVKVHSRVDGRMLKRDLEVPIGSSRYRGLTDLYAGTRFEISGTQAVQFEFEGVSGVRAFLDGKPIETVSGKDHQLDAGSHVLILKLNPHALPEHLRVSISRGSFI